METLITILVGILVAAATYLILSRNLIRVILGTSLLSHAAHLLIMTMGGLKNGNVPLLGAGAPFVDALPQALILTAIVISFGVTALLLVLVYRSHQEAEKDDVAQVREVDDE
ncbi:Na(+)/H(+) antiporter subunit C [Bacillus sp. FJAT-50079]|uniref:Na(+)/H(+) antiporter subunit C n=1 Tax=Bacillus sp. FJAT-50079 TaxID=2833577 RepID=UPI001BC95416|nr:Na(+)/H(+) antiporter subunit C [Bacillus sp. FJAT-50079]MBS4208373.1 Na(+)/H(+) antiporter subunit C [Bacillus sp. FJAT-50079]